MSNPDRVLSMLVIISQDRILMGAERKSQYLDEKAKLATAYHEVRSVPLYLTFHLFYV